MVHAILSQSSTSMVESFNLRQKLILVFIFSAPKAIARKLSPAEQQQLVVSFHAMTNSNFRKTLQELSKEDGLSHLLQSIPGLADDPVAVSMLLDWELFLHSMVDLKCVQTLVEKHPSLVDAAAKLVATYQESASADQLQQRQRRHGWPARSLGAEAMDMEAETSNPQPSTSNTLTPAQFAAALAFVNRK